MDISNEIFSLSSHLHDLPPELRQHIEAVLQIKSNITFLDELSAAALVPQLTVLIFTTCNRLAVDLCTRWQPKRYLETIAAYGRTLQWLPYLSEIAHAQLIAQTASQDVVEELYQQFAKDGAAVRTRQELLLGLLRLLHFNHNAFAKLIKPARFQLLLHDSDRVSRYLAVRILCIYIHASDAVMEEMLDKYLGSGAIDGVWEGKEIDYRFLNLWEEKRLADITELMRATVSPKDGNETPYARTITATDLSTYTLDVSGVLLPRLKLTGNISSHNLVNTTTTSSNLCSLAVALRKPQPILITGLAGAGKTTLVRHLAGSLGKSDSMVTLHLNEQSDAKLLIGIYTTGSQPGSFEWQPGVLTTAVKEGRWVFIEDLDRAPNEVMSTLLPLIERGELVIPSRGERLRAAEGFRIIATMRTTVNLQGEEVAPSTRLLGARLWQCVSFHSPVLDELRHIIQESYPVLASLLKRIMATYSRLKRELSSGRGAQMSSSRTRTISARELLKWCARINELMKTETSRSRSDTISEAALNGMFLDAVDCFTGSFEDGPDKDILVACIAEEWHISPQQMTHMLQDRLVPVKRTKLYGEDGFAVGRAEVVVSSLRQKAAVIAGRSTAAPYAITAHSSRLLEQVAVAVQRAEPMLLVGETGIGKTTAVQHLAHMLNHKLLAINLSQQSESGDLLGGFKPITTRSLVIPMQDEFSALFEQSFSMKKNQEFIQKLNRSIVKGDWKLTLKCWQGALKMVDKALESNEVEKRDENGGEQRAKRRKPNSMKPDRLLWNNFREKVETMAHRFAGSAEVFTFSFTEGKLVKAVREGDWVLLDEINLATPDTLECLSDLLESGPGTRPSIMLTETGQVERVEAHPNFRIFAAMNPATDVGKKDLPMGIRSRFTEIYVNPPDRDIPSLQTLIGTYLQRAALSTTDQRLPIVVTELYQEIQRLVRDEGLVDGSGQRPHYSLRTLTRALSHATSTASRSTLRRALYEGFSMCFFTALDTESEQKLQELVKSKLFTTPVEAKAELKRSLKQPADGKEYVRIALQVQAMDKGSKAQEERHWMAKGPAELEDAPQYIVTPYIARNLRNVIRAASTGKHPILIQGPTSAGKTSMIEYLARRSGNMFVRINNHEHTDLQEYLGSYVSTSDGQLVFQEGVLVQAVRAGHWVVLDELNLAPTDVLEALNRLLDDNRELLTPETQEVVRPHPGFMLFATQNPAGPYGGRKMLSRAFRNRFLELHFDDIPVQELNTILARRSSLPESWCSLIVEVYKRLSALRQEQRLFEQNSFATLRDLFRWAFRGANSVEELADNGYMLLAEKVRNPEERDMVKQTLEKVMSRKGVKIHLDDETLYKPGRCPEVALYDQVTNGGIVWTRSMRRLYVLVATAIRHNEAVLLVGETGCGKTTVCQMLAQAVKQQLHIVNAHQNTETGDLIGAQRPIRNRAAVTDTLLSDLTAAFRLLAVSDEPEIDLEAMLTKYDVAVKDKIEAVPEEIRSRIASNRTKRKALFEWSDGSLIQAMREGSFYLLDEISLADDSVLERMNSILDPQRSILLAEKGTVDSLVTAVSGFQFFATMNPGGDFGKKELSPALRNRFTEIWVPPLSNTEDVLEIVRGKIVDSATSAARIIVEFAKWFSDRFSTMKASTISIRDILAFVQFVNSQGTDLTRAIVHGASMVYIDTLGANPAALLAITGKDIQQERTMCLNKLSELLDSEHLESDINGIYHEDLHFSTTEAAITIGSFSIARRGPLVNNVNFNFQAPTTKINTMRVARALQVNKPILLEGNPGVGKTSIITALAQAVGVPLTRINLSEQTDLMDLFGSDMPVEGAEAGQFAWRDAPFLTAMKNGEWVLLDEMNLASQSVLEGLNACLDHRGEVYIAELDQRFLRHPDFRLFAAQNPHHQGGGRKGLPASFVNRFTVVYADVFKQDDLQMICQRLFPNADIELTSSIVAFVSALDAKVMTEQYFGARGAPWEFNLRDTLRWLHMCTSTQGLLPAGTARDFLENLFTLRFRSDTDRQEVQNLFNLHLGEGVSRDLYTNLTKSTLQIGLGLAPRNRYLQSAEVMTKVHMQDRLAILETLLMCVQQQLPVLLVGASGAGKTYLLESLSSLLGVDLETFPMNADVDAMDLVGGFEQADVSRRVQSLLAALEDQVRVELAIALETSDPAASLLSDLLEHLTDFEQPRNLSSLKDKLQAVMQSRSSNELRHLYDECVTLEAIPQVVSTAKFEWIDGILVRALEQGRWLVLDNANLCSSSVLDRLNSLLEPNGTLIINEHPAEDGTARIITPHPNFRIFMTLDPQYGEVSRAMRNRAVEIFVPMWNEERTTTPDVSALRMHSAMQHFHYLVDLCNNAQGGVGSSALVEYAARMLSPKDLQMLQVFGKQVQNGLVAPAMQVNLSQVIAHFEASAKLQDSWHLVSSQYHEDLRIKLHETADFGTSQSINTLFNQPLVALNSRYTPRSDAVHDPFILVLKQDLLFELTRMHAALVQARETDQRASLMTRLQRSYAAARLPQVKKESTIWSAPFLNNVLTSILEWVISNEQDNQSATATRPLLGAILTYWWNFFNLVSSPAFDEAIFQVYLSIGQRMLNAAGSADAALNELVSSIMKHFQGFHAQTKMLSGLSMERIWQLLHPPLVPTTKRLEDIWQLEQVADHFDSVVWSLEAPLDDLVALRAAIVQALDLARRQEVDVQSLTQDLENDLAPLNPANKGEVSRREPFFKEAFEGLCQLLDIAQDDGQNPTLALLACRELKKSRTNLGWSLQAFALTKVTSFASTAASNTAVEGSLPLLLLHKTHTSADVSLRDHGLLKAEIDCLGAEIANNTSLLCTDVIRNVQHTLEAIVDAVTRAHQDTVEVDGDAASRITSVPNTLKCKADIEASVQHTVEQYLQSSMHSTYDETGTTHLKDVALRFIKTAIGLISLYVPDRPYDPSLPAQVQRALYDSLMSSLEQKFATLCYLARCTTGQESSLSSRLVQEDIKALGPLPATTAVARPAQSQLELLQTDFANLLNLVSRISRDMNDVDAFTERSNDYLQGVVAIVERLRGNNKVYTDIVEPAIGFTQIMKIGLILFAQTSQAIGTSGPQKKLQAVLRYTPLMMESPATYATDLPSLELRRDPQLILHNLGLLAFRSQLVKLRDWTAQAQTDLITFFSVLYSVWETQLNKDQKEAAAASSLYEYKGSFEDEEEASEQELNSLFPIYDDDESQEARTSQEQKLNLATITSDVAMLHMRVFNADSQSASSVADLLRSAARIVGTNREEGPAFQPMTMQGLLPAILLTLHEQQQGIMTGNSPSKTYNVYTDTNIQEAKKVITLVEATQAVIRPILEIWPEHATLHNILGTCDELLAFRHTEPVMKFLTKTEKLHGQIAEWQKVASKEYSAAAVLNRTTDLLISWRQLELSTWARMLDLEFDKAQTDARSWYFLAYENVIHRPMTLDMSSEQMAEHATELVISLESFMAASTLGQYATKLKILVALQAHLNVAAEDRPSLVVISKALKNFIAHYERFLPAILKAIETGRKGLEKDMRNTIQLASWRDRNIEALKQSARKSHSKLFKVIRKFRAVLGQPAGPIISQDLVKPLPEITSTASIDHVVNVEIPTEVEASLRQHNELWTARPERFREVQSTATLMQLKAAVPTASLNTSDHLRSFIEELEVSIDHLAKATPSTLTEENAPQVKHLTARKRKVFADTLKDLRIMGLKSNVSIDVLATQASTAKILSSMPVLESIPASAAEDLLSRILDVMPKVRSAHTEHNDDLTQAEIARCIGYLESLLVIVLKQRTNIARASESHAKLQAQLDQVKHLWSANGFAVIPLTKTSADQIKGAQVYLPWLPAIIRGGIAVLNAQSSLAKVNMDGLTASLEEYAVKIEGITADLGALPTLPDGLTTPAYQAILDRRADIMASLTTMIDDWSVKLPTTKVTLDHIAKWLNVNTSNPSQDLMQVVASSSGRSQPIDSILSDHYSVLNKILGSVQDVASALQQLPTSPEDPSWFLRDDKAQQQVFSSFHIDAIVQSLQGVLDSLKPAGSPDNSSLELVCTSLTLALPILSQYQSSLSNHLHRYIDTHTATCNLTYRLARSFVRISSQGFCKPAEASDEKGGASEKLESGTGLGEGEGAEDISKDIGGDEDLEDLAQDPENKREGGEVENEDDAVSIQDELEGGAGEAKGGEQEEDDKKNDKDKDKEDEEGEEGSVGEGGEDGGQEDVEDEAGIDEDMGDVDDLGPSAVDEKMWDQAGDEAQKEQESENQAGQVDKNEQSAGKEEQKKDEKEAAEGAEDGDDEKEGEEDDDLSDLGSDAGGPQEDIAMDPHVKEDEGLELPEELKLDGDKGDERDDKDLDDDIQDINGEGEEDTEDARPDELDQPDQTDAEAQEEQANDAEQQAGDLEIQPEEGQDDEAEKADAQADVGETGEDQDMGDVDQQGGGGLANDRDTEHDDQQATDADARDETLQEDQQEQNPSASAARRQAGQEKSGTTDQTQSATAEQASPDDQQPQASNDRQTVRKLGDILEKWHRQQRQIRETASDRPEDMAPQDIDMADAEFEHLPDEDAAADTQALGASSKEQARALDESMAVETEDNIEDRNVDNRLQNADEEEVADDHDEDMPDAEPSTATGADTQAEARPRTFVGDRRDMNEPIDISPPASPSQDPTNLTDVEDDLHTLALTTRPPSPSANPPTDPSALWAHHESRTLPLSLTLTEHLRLILAPTLATKLRGDFRTGKRLNIKRIIPYIASQYKRDKIWMRRSVPSKRAYQVLLAIDDSKSMAENGSSSMAFDTLALVAKALTALEVGEVGVLAFGEDVDVAREFGAGAFGGDEGAKLLSRFGFKQERTNVRRLVQKSIDMFREARGKASAQGGADLWQLELIVSDGICEDHEGIRRLLLQAQEERIMIVFVIVDAAATSSTAASKGMGNQQNQSSIVDLEKVEFVQVKGTDGEGEMKLVRTKYLDTFPFGYYLVVKDVRDLPGVLSTALRQWFAEVAER